MKGVYSPVLRQIANLLIGRRGRSSLDQDPARVPQTYASLLACVLSHILFNPIVPNAPSPFIGGRAGAQLAKMYPGLGIRA